MRRIAGEFATPAFAVPGVAEGSVEEGFEGWDAGGYYSYVAFETGVVEASMSVLCTILSVLIPTYIAQIVRSTSFPEKWSVFAIHKGSAVYDTCRKESAYKWRQCF